MTDPQPRRRGRPRTTPRPEPRSDLAAEFGRRLLAARLAADVSRPELVRRIAADPDLAGQSAVGEETLSAYEDGTQVPRLDLALWLAHHLHFPLPSI